MTCTCGAYYVGKTKRPRAKMIMEHVNAAKAGFFKATIGKHMALDHNYQCGELTFPPLAVIPPNERGGDWDKVPLQKESSWIFKLQAHVHPGLNDCISYAPFL